MSKIVMVFRAFDSLATTKFKIMSAIEEFDEWLHELIKENGITNY